MTRALLAAADGDGNGDGQVTAAEWENFCAGLQSPNQPPPAPTTEAPPEG